MVDWRHMHTASFFAQFLYLLFYRVCHLLLPDYFTIPPAQTDDIQMMLTLKMVGVAFEIHDSIKVRLKEVKTETDELFLRYRAVDPSLLDIFHYAFSHIGFLTGPHFKYRTYDDLYNYNYYRLTNADRAAWDKFKFVPLYISLFYISGYLFPLTAVQETGFYTDTTLAYRLIYTVLLFIAFRTRLYTGFVLSECSCVVAGLGAYPSRSQPKPGHGPTRLEALKDLDKETEEMDFETVSNVCEWKTESVATMRESLKYWNSTVQFWLATVVYQRFPWRSVRAGAVMLVSAVWHGVKPGYFLSLCSFPLVLAVENLYYVVLRSRLGPRGQVVYDWTAWVARSFWIPYLVMAFQLLDVESTMRFWSSINYLGHLSLVLFYLAGLLIVKPLLGQVVLKQKND